MRRNAGPSNSVRRTASHALPRQRTLHSSFRLFLKEVCPDYNRRRPGKELTVTLRHLPYPNRGMVQTINSLAHRRRSGQTALCLGRHQPCLLGEVAPQLCLHLRVRVLWLVHSSWDRPGKSQVQKTRSPAHHLQRTPQLSSCLLLKEVCQDRNKRRPGKGPKATFRPLRQTNRGMVLALNSFAHRPHDRRTAHYRKTSSHVDG